MTGAHRAPTGTGRHDQTPAREEDGSLGTARGQATRRRRAGVVVGAGGSVPGLLHGHLGHHDRQRRAAGVAQRSGCGRGQPAMGRGRYLLMLAALALAGGALADRVCARRIFQVGLGIFMVASAICGLARDVVVLVIARLVQGIGAALSVPASLALLRAAFPDTDTRARAIGVLGRHSRSGCGHRADPGRRLGQRAELATRVLCQPADRAGSDAADRAVCTGA
jgi:hypothetical protein